MTTDPSGNFYQKKIVKNGPGFSSVTIVSSGSFSASSSENSGNNDIFSSMFGEMSRIMSMMGSAFDQAPS